MESDWPLEVGYFRLRFGIRIAAVNCFLFPATPPVFGQLRGAPMASVWHPAAETEQ